MFTREEWRVHQTGRKIDNLDVRPFIAYTICKKRINKVKIIMFTNYIAILEQSQE